MNLVSGDGGERRRPKDFSRRRKEGRLLRGNGEQDGWKPAGETEQKENGRGGD